MVSAHPLGRELTFEELESFQFQFGFFPKHSVQIPLPNALLFSPPYGKVSIPISLFEVGLCLPTMDFFNLIIHEYGFSVTKQTLVSINEIVGYKLLYHALFHQSTVPAFKYFFNASTHSGTQNLSRRRGVPTLIQDKKNPKRTGRRSFYW
ncbi:unnamed protein product [Lactuca saligna]|uniref:Uncharacterized protein n=1 Tax=Lactuca saligna TaxID=75948 RepID=A0AA35V1P3_LACSI|nr:unnamed protein product [Lactuca saligna]